MKWSWKITNVAFIDVHLHMTFLIVTDGSRIAGISDIDNIMELLRIQKALQEHDEHRW